MGEGRVGTWTGRLKLLWIRGRVRVGIPVPLRTPDRIVLERQILPWFATQVDVKTVLFVGTAWYSAHYPRLMPRQAFWTLDPVPDRKRYGARQHIVATLDQIHEHLAPSSPDLVVLNGVIGYGLDDPATIEASLDAAHWTLRPGGHLLLGWDAVPHRCPVRPECIRALQRFRRSAASPFGHWRYVVEASPDGKTYDFYCRQS